MSDADVRFYFRFFKIVQTEKFAVFSVPSHLTSFHRSIFYDVQTESFESIRGVKNIQTYSPQLSAALVSITRHSITEKNDFS